MPAYEWLDSRSEDFLPRSAGSLSLSKKGPASPHLSVCDTASIGAQSRKVEGIWYLRICESFCRIAAIKVKRLLTPNPNDTRGHYGGPAAATQPPVGRGFGRNNPGAARHSPQYALCRPAQSCCARLIVTVIGVALPVSPGAGAAAARAGTPLPAELSGHVRADSKSQPASPGATGAS